MAVAIPLAMAVGPTLASWGIGAAATAGAFGAGSAAYTAFSMADAIGEAASTISMVGSAVGAVTSAVGARNEGIAANNEATYKAQEANVQAGQDLAASQRTQVEQIRQMRLVESKVQANAAGSGAGALDPSVMDIMGDLETQGRYKSAVAGYQGQDQAANLNSQANLYRFSGNQALQAGNTKAISTLMTGASDLRTKYDEGSYY